MSQHCSQTFRGEKSHTAKLTEDEVLFIFNSKQSSSKLSKKFGVSRSAIKNIKNGKTWSYLTGKAHNDDR